MGRARNTPATAEGKIEIRFNGEPHHMLTADGVTIAGGKTGFVDAATAKQLLAAEWANVTLADPAAATWPENDEELDELAAKVGVELPNVSAAGGDVPPTRADKIAALEAAGYTPDSATAAEQACSDESGSSDTAEKE